MQNVSQTTLSDEQILDKIQKQETKLRFLVPSYIVKLRYKFWLVLLREISILVQLMNHYEQIPSKTFSKALISLFVKSSKMKNLLFAVEKRLRKRIY